MTLNENRSTPESLFDYNRGDYSNRITHSQQQEILFLRGKILSHPRNYISHIKTINSSLGEHDPFSASHCFRISQIVSSIPDFFNQFDEKIDIEDMKNAAIYHDIGKNCVPKETLIKKETLTPQEVKQIQQHPHFSFLILKDTNGVNNVITDIAHNHHEKWDGTGYPNGFKGEEIPFSARVFSVFDNFDALVSKRSYKKGMSIQTALQIMETESGKRYDPKILAVFVKSISQFQFQQGSDQILQFRAL